MAFSPENLKIWVNSREIHAFIETATYPPFTKGTCWVASHLCSLSSWPYPYLAGVCTVHQCHELAYGHRGPKRLYCSCIGQDSPSRVMDYLFVGDQLKHRVATPVFS